jgi:hypothetical protein
MFVSPISGNGKLPTCALSRGQRSSHLSLSEYQYVVVWHPFLGRPTAGNRHGLSIMRDDTGGGGSDLAAPLCLGLDCVVVVAFLCDRLDTRITSDGVVFAVVGSEYSM